MTKRYGYVIDPRGKRIDTETTYDPKDHLTPKRRSGGQRFAKLTEERLKLLAGVSAAWSIYCYLLMVNWKKLRQPVKLTNQALAGIGVSRYAKRRALLQLERAGLVKVKRHTDHEAPLVIPLK
jgi:hypothetical protein